MAQATNINSLFNNLLAADTYRDHLLSDMCDPHGKMARELVSSCVQWADKRVVELTSALYDELKAMGMSERTAKVIIWSELSSMRYQHEHDEYDYEAQQSDDYDAMMLERAESANIPGSRTVIKASPVSHGWWSSDRFACRIVKRSGREGRKPILAKQHRERVTAYLEA